MTRHDEQLDAAEYVIGTLSGAERAAFEQLVQFDPSAQSDVSFWQRIFGDLNSTVPPVAPDERVWTQIRDRLFPQDGSLTSESLAGTGTATINGLGLAEAVKRTNAENVGTEAEVAGSTIPHGRPENSDSAAESDLAQTAKSSANINQAGAGGGNVVQIKRSRSRWRLGAIAATLAALGLGYGLFNHDARGRVDGMLNAGIAKLNNSLGISPANAPDNEQDLAQDDDGTDKLAQNEATDEPSNGANTANGVVDGGKNYIAVVNANADQPALIVKVNATTGEVSVRSLGVEKPAGKSLEVWYVEEGAKAVSVGLLGEGKIDLGKLAAKSGDLFAISVEPEGGAPEGVATGPVIYSGKLIEDVESEIKVAPAQ